MKVIKDIEQSLLFSTVGLGGKWYLSVAVMLFFKLDDPETAITEQELWPLVQKRLGGEILLDSGFPKPCGEFLAAGRAFWPGMDSLKDSFHERYPSSKVMPGMAMAQIKVGELTRTLAVFGKRNWQFNPLGPSPSPPQDMTTVPLTWDRTYGGPSYLDNPIGLGADVLLSQVGEKYQPLPQVEDYHQLMGNPDDTPQPASFLPVSYALPSRKILCGTYDDQWFNHRWPGFPDDLNPAFFSVAHPRQILPQGFFKGGEKVSIEGCHPEKYHQESFVPRTRVRLFLTTGLKKQPDKFEFTEVETRLETVWLFPEDERGLVLHRTLVEVADEEYSNLRTLFVVVEEPQEEAKDLEYYWAEQQRRKTIVAPIDMTPFQKAADRTNDMVRNFRTLDQDVDMEVARHLGQAPRTLMTPDQVIEDNQAGLATLKDMLGEHKELLRTSKKKFGHLVPIDIRMLDPMEEKLGQISKKLSETQIVLAESKAKVMAASQATLDKLRNEYVAAFPPIWKDKMEAGLKEAGLDMSLEDMMDLDRKHPWSREAIKTLALGQRQMAPDEKRHQLKKLGLRPRDIRSGLFGMLTEAVEVDPARWNLSPEELPPDWDKTVGPGWLVAEFQGSLAVSLTVRPLDDVGPYNPGLAHERDWVMPGSKPGASLLGGGLGRPLILATDPFQAWLLYAEAGDQYMILCLSDPGAELLPEIPEILASAPLALLAVPLAEQENQSLLEPWLGLIPNLQFFCFEKGNHLFESRDNGFDIREAILQFLPQIGLEIPPEYGVHMPEKPEDAGQLSIQVPKFDLEALAKRTQDKIRAYVNSKVPDPKAHFESLKAKVLEAAKPSEFCLKGAGKSLSDWADQVVWDDSAKPPVPSGPNQKFLDALDEAEKDLEKKKILKPAGKAKIKEMREAHIEVTEKTRDLYLKCMEVKKEGEERLANPFTPEQLAEAKALGVDLNPVPVTVELIIERHQRGETIDTLNLSDLDFSGLNLAGLKLSKVFLNNTIFRDTDLSGADFNMCSGSKIDFKEANLQGAKSYMSSFNQSDFTYANLMQFNAEMASFSEGTFNKTSFEGADFDRCIFTKSTFDNGCRLERSRFYLSIFTGARLENVAAEDAAFPRSVFSEGVVKNCHFSRGIFTGTLFINCKVDDLLFEDGDLTNARFSYQTVMRNIIFRRCILDKSCFNNTEMAGTVFDTCHLDLGYFEESNLTACDFIACQAPRALIRKCDLTGSYMVALDIREGSFRRSDLSGVDLSYANCHTTEFYKTIMADTNLTGANLRLTLLETREAVAKKKGYIR